MPILACFATWQSRHKTQPNTYISTCIGILADPAGNKSDMRAETSCPVFLCLAGNSTGSCSALCVAPVFLHKSEVPLLSHFLRFFVFQLKDKVKSPKKNLFIHFLITGKPVCRCMWLLCWPSRLDKHLPQRISAEVAEKFLLSNSQEVAAHLGVESTVRMKRRVMMREVIHEQGLQLTGRLNEKWESKWGVAVWK